MSTLNPPTYESVKQDLNINPMHLQHHDERVAMIIKAHRSRLLKPDGSISPVRRKRR